MHKQILSMTLTIDGKIVSSPPGKVILVFTPTEDFGIYEKGLDYYLREGNLKLAKNLLEWPVDIDIVDEDAWLLLKTSRRMPPVTEP